MATDEKRHDWKQEAADNIGQRGKERQDLINQIVIKRREINEASALRDWAKYDALMEEKAELAAKLAQI